MHNQAIPHSQGLFCLYPLPEDPGVPPPPRHFQELPPSQPQQCLVRVYIVRALDLSPRDRNGMVRPPPRPPPHASPSVTLTAPLPAASVTPTFVSLWDQRPWASVTSMCPTPWNRFLAGRATTGGLVALPLLAGTERCPGGLLGVPIPHIPNLPAPDDERSLLLRPHSSCWRVPAPPRPHPSRQQVPLPPDAPFPMQVCPYNTTSSWHQVPIPRDSGSPCQRDAIPHATKSPRYQDPIPHVTKSPFSIAAGLHAIQYPFLVTVGPITPSPHGTRIPFPCHQLPIPHHGRSHNTKFPCHQLPIPHNTRSHNTMSPWHHTPMPPAPHSP